LDQQERAMSRHYRTIVAICGLLAASFSFAAAPAHAAASVVYMISGVLDNGAGDGVGLATAFHCTNLAGTNNNMTIAIHNSLGKVVGGDSRSIPPKETVTWTTHQQSMFAAINLETGAVFQGYAVISATNPNLTCSSMMMNAAVNEPRGIALHMQRRAPLPNTQE
jgi:hypothetical protein